MSLQHIREFLVSRTLRDRVLFSSSRRRATSVVVRGDQMAEELGGCCLRTKYLTDSAVCTAPALIWIVEHRPELLERFRGMTPQILDVINPPPPEIPVNIENRYQSFRYLLLNTESMVRYLGPEPESGWRSWVVPHHHCNTSGFVLPQERIEKPVTVGYVGEPEHLHDTEAIQSVAAKLGLVWVSAPSYELDAYQTIDIGVAWTRRDQTRDETRSNIKLANFAAHGIPSVVCDYESYRAVDQRLGGGSTLLCSSPREFTQSLAELATNLELRMAVSAKARPALDLYSRKQIGIHYTDIIRQVREEFEARRA